ncbi:DNL zinc finger containing protein [Novymonas esmeraldas]|uniref:DNL zinc finger containing protein n=1 Tax=Novymonas esmeraldas TaxID=1808958 RepID=A0AAW0F1E1_9TRYP
MLHRAALLTATRMGAVRRCAPSLSLTHHTQRRLALTAVTAARRWCSTTPTATTSTQQSSPHPSTPPSSDASTTSTTTAAAAASLAAHGSATDTLSSVSEQLKRLSPEDQQRILSALRAPEKEKSSVMGGGGIGPADGDMVAAFTCGPCDYRMVKRFSKHAYTKGIVIVECPNCRAKHLLADNLGWMEDSATNIEAILAARGESFTRIGGTEGDYQAVAEPSTVASRE